MTEDEKRAAELAERARAEKKAAELAKRASQESKQAAKDAARAAKVAAEPIVDAVAEEVQDTAQKLEGTAEDAVKTAKRINPWALSRISRDTGEGFLALAVALWAGTIAVNKFRGAYTGRRYVLESTVKADHHIRPSE